MKGYIENDYKALEQFLIDNPDLEKLEELLEQFNIFEALSIIKQEIRHSDFLSFLLNPRETHGLNDYFLKYFIKRVLLEYKEQHAPFSIIDLDTWDLNGTLVLREWNNIDIFIENKENRFIIAIENKVTSSEQGDQLKRYKELCEKQYSEWRRIYIYLTPEGDIPSDESWIVINYSQICNMTEEVLKRLENKLGDDFRLLLRHYIQMLRRYIVSDSPIEELCRKIYQKHRHAIDLILEYRPDLQASIRGYLEQLIREDQDLILESGSKAYIRFSLKSWDVATLRQGGIWIESKRMLVFEFKNYLDRLYLGLIIGPGNQEIRQKLFEIAKRAESILKLGKTKSLGRDFCTIFTKRFLDPKDYETDEVDEILNKIQKEWELFKNHDLPKIRAIFDAEVSKL